jgi:hypothetical protein
MMQHHHWSLTEIENMMPWEKDIYVSLLADFVQQEQERQRKENAG